MLNLRESAMQLRAWFGKPEALKCGMGLGSVDSLGPQGLHMWLIPPSK